MTETIEDTQFSAVDDGLHELSGFYDTETFWFSFFVPERSLGGWLYTTVRPIAGVSGGGAWIWDATAIDPWSIPFFEQFDGETIPVDCFAMRDRSWGRRNERGYRRVR